MKKLETHARWAMMTALLTFSSGCAATKTTNEINEAEFFPERNSDPRLGLIINNDVVPANLRIYDAANRRVAELYLSGANAYLTINNKRQPQYVVMLLEIGEYRLEVLPFFYRNKWLFWGRERIDLPRRHTNFTVDRNPNDHYYGSREWGWSISVRRQYGSNPGPWFQWPKINIQGGGR